MCNVSQIRTVDGLTLEEAGREIAIIASEVAEAVVSNSPSPTFVVGHTMLKSNRRLIKAVSSQNYAKIFWHLSQHMVRYEGMLIVNA